MKDGAAPPVLLIDAGNTRIKWARARGGRLGPVTAATWSARGLPALVRRMLRAGGGAGILACNVAGPRFERELRRAARRAGVPPPRFARSVRAAAGVRNGYHDTWRLGADRWVALVGAHSRHPRRAVCVVGVGTALTVDLLDARGRHRGGLLVPGPALMVRSLLERTAGIRTRAGAVPQALRARASRARFFGRSTRAGLAGGATLAAVALIERAQREAHAVLGVRPRLLLCGGGAARLATLLGRPARRADELVLEGLWQLHALGAADPGAAGGVEPPAVQSATVRWLVYTLLLANLLFYGATHWLAGRPQVVPPSLPPLQLAAAPVAPPAGASAAPRTRCESLGPLADTVAVAALATALRARNLPPVERSGQYSSDEGYAARAALPADEPARSRLLRRLARAGLGEPAEPAATELALGVFNTREAAEQRAALAREAGAGVRVEALTRIASGYWLDVQLPDDAAPPPAAALAGSLILPPAVRWGSCAPPAAAPAETAAGAPGSAHPG